MYADVRGEPVDEGTAAAALQVQDPFVSAEKGGWFLMIEWL